MSRASISAGVGLANQPIAISSSPTLPSPRVFLQKPKLPRLPSGGTKENEGHDEQSFSPSVTEQSRIPFNELVGNFGCSRSAASPKRPAHGEAPTKRRLIELQDQKALAPVQRRAKIDVLPAAKSVKRPKSPKKKVQTITALATAAYQQKRDTSDQTAPPEPSHSRPVPAESDAAPTPAIPEAANGSKPKKPRKPRAKAAESGTKSVKAKKVAKPKKAKAKDAVPKQELYSPQRATERLLQQDFLFGTSSQLAAPDSPTLIRQVQTAMGESEAALISSQALRAAQHKSYFKVPSAPQGTNLSIGQANKELWCSAARDLKGAVARTLSAPSKVSKPAVAITISVQTIPVPDEREPGTSDLLAKPEEGAELGCHITASAASITETPKIAADSSGFIDIEKYTSFKPPPATYRVVDALTTSSPKSHPALLQPDSALPTTRRTLSELIDLDDIPPSTQAMKQTRPKKPAARKKKVMPATPQRQPTFRPLEDISDDENVAPPSPPRVRAGKSPSAIKPLTLSPAGSQIGSPEKNVRESTALTVTASIKVTDDQWSEIAELLFPRITETVKAAPYSTKMEDITWHEKILLYDPIILEDFTAWLNEQGLRITVTRMKRKTTTKTKGRKKKDQILDAADEVVTEPTSETETVEESLQTWMVQKWCEEHSICCCSKDTYKGSVRAKY